MQKSRVIEKLNRLEKEIKFLKSAFFPEVNLDIDKKIWGKVKKELKKSRAKVFKRVYGR